MLAKFWALLMARLVLSMASLVAGGKRWTATDADDLHDDDLLLLG